MEFPQLTALLLVISGVTGATGSIYYRIRVYFLSCLSLLSILSVTNNCVLYARFLKQIEMACPRHQMAGFTNSRRYKKNSVEGGKSQTMILGYD